MPSFALLVLKVVFLALLYFFVYRALHAVVVEPRGWAPTGAVAGVAERPKPGGRDRPPRSVVVIDERGAKVQTLRLDGNVQVGRAEACQVKLADTYVSTFHARLFHRDGAWFVEDLGSTNGTYLNQRRVTSPAELKAGDQLKVGRTTLELKR